MSGTHFYVTLPSNASLDIFPYNKTSGYRVKLPHPIELNGYWEVGLYSISYPYSWYTLSNYGPDMHFYFTSPTEPFIPSAVLKYGHYETMEAFTKGMNDALKEERNSTINLTYSSLTGKVTVHLQAGSALFLYPPISLILGYGGQEVTIKAADGAAQEAPHVATLRTFTSIYAYCDIVQPQIVGDTSAQLLRSIPVEGKYGGIVTKTFTNIQYVPDQTKSFEDVKILLRNDTGDPVPFERGKVIATLHFRQHTYFH